MQSDGDYVLAALSIDYRHCRRRYRGRGWGFHGRKQRQDTMSCEQQCRSSRPIPHSNRQPSKHTANPTATSISPESLGFSAGKTTTACGSLQTSLPYTGCPANNGSAYTSYFPNSKFELYCGLDILYAGTSGLLYVITPTFELCTEACASFNDNGRKNAGATMTCGGVAFIPSHVNGDIQGLSADCIPKHYPNMLRLNQKYVVDSAVLQ